MGILCSLTQFGDEILMGSVRAQERTTLDEIYCRTVGAKHLREGGSHFNPIVLKNLEAYQPARHEILTWVGTERLKDFSEHVNNSHQDQPLHLSISQAGAAVRVDVKLASTLWRVGSWLHLIDIDMGQRISMVKPMRRGKDHCIQQLAKHFMGEIQ